MSGYGSPQPCGSLEPRGYRAPGVGLEHLRRHAAGQVLTFYVSRATGERGERGEAPSTCVDRRGQWFGVQKNPVRCQVSESRDSVPSVFTPNMVLGAQ